MVQQSDAYVIKYDLVQSTLTVQLRDCNRNSENDAGLI